jgi:hypothetical protein
MFSMLLAIRAKPHFGLGQLHRSHTTNRGFIKMSEMRTFLIMLKKQSF